MAAVAERVSLLEHFACPDCGRTREISERAARAIRSGARTGTCRTGEGCKAALPRIERDRRWWLEWAGVQPHAITLAGGACQYVIRHGLPPALGELEFDMPGAPAA